MTVLSLPQSKKEYKAKRFLQELRTLLDIHEVTFNMHTQGELSFFFWPHEKEMYGVVEFRNTVEVGQNDELANRITIITRNEKSIDD